MVLIGTDQGCDPDSIGHVYAFERNTGKVRWKYRSTSVPTDIVRFGPNVYFGSFQDRWSAVNLATGESIWSYSTGTANKDCVGIKSPVADNSHLYLAGLDGIIYSLDATSSRVVWKRKLPAPPSTALALKDQSLFVGTSDNHIYRLKTETGTSEAELLVDSTPVGRLTFNSDALFLFLENRSERTGQIISLELSLLKLLWNQKSARDWASERPNLWRGFIIAGDCRGQAAAFRASDGAPQWKLDLKGCIRSIGNSGDTLFVGVQEGTVYALGY